MSNPRPESRIKSLEQRATDIEADIVELASDQAEELKAIRQDINQLEAHVDLGFLQARDLMMQELGEMKREITSIKTTQERQERLLQEILNRLPEKS